MIYAIASTAAGPFKIGRTNNVKARLANLQTARPDKLELWCSLWLWSVRPVDLSDQVVERFFHGLFADRRMRGEWFDISLDDLLEVLNTESYLINDVPVFVDAEIEDQVIAYVEAREMLAGLLEDSLFTEACSL